MGTSASQRSPSTAEWERVRELYRHPNPDPGHIASQIVAALEPAALRSMAGPGVSLCLGTVLQGSRQAHRMGLAAMLAALKTPPGPPAIQMAAGLRGYAERQIVQVGAASRFGDLALDAIGTLSLAVAGGPAADSGGQMGIFQLPAATVETRWGSYAKELRYDALAAQFMAHDFDHVMRYIVSRDLSEFIGTDAIPTVLVGTQLVERVGQYCRERTRGIVLGDFADDLPLRLEAGGSKNAQAFEPLVEAGISQGLQLLAGGGASL